MVTEPITLYAKVADPVHAYRVLREVSPKFEADGLCLKPIEKARG